MSAELDDVWNEAFAEGYATGLTDDGYLLLAIADDFLAAHDDGELIDPHAVYDWLVAQAHKIGGAA